MKKFFLISLVIAAFSGNAISQGCPNQPVQSPVSKKPTALALASVNCNQLVVKWQGNPGQSYKFDITVKDAGTGKAIKTPVKAVVKNNGLNYTATIPVKAGTKISWSVQGITTLHGRIFYSYSPRGGKDLVIPDCQSPAAATAQLAEKSVIVNDSKVTAQLYPNPVQSILNVSLGVNSNMQKTVNIFDSYGKMVINQRTAQNNIQLTVKQLSSGTYFIRIIDEKGKAIYNGRFIKLQ